MSSPVKAIYAVARRFVFDHAIQSASHKEEGQGAEVPAGLWQRMQPSLFKKFPLVASYRTSSLMTAEAMVKAGLREDHSCELCGQPYSLKHLVQNCPALVHVRNEHNAAQFQHLPLMTLVTGLPAVHPCPPIDLPQEPPPTAAITPYGMHHFQ